MNLIFATQNAHKAKEIQALMPSGIQVLTLADINCDADIPETAKTLEGNAALKSAYVVENFGENCFADDTGLEIEGLDGRPGVSSARYAGENKDSEANMDKVLLELKNQSNRKARFRTVISLRIGSHEHQFEGVVEGTIRSEKSGTDGFGYDPIFEPEGYDVTFSEMSMEAKNKISHRGRAVSKLIDYINENLSL